VAKKDYTVYAEIKLLDYGRREVVQFFYAVDGHGHGDRLVEDLAGHV
jgi:hypothetical protein